GRRSATVGGRTVFVVIRAWPDDAAWRERVSDVVLRALPVLGDEIGAPWPFDEPLTVAETLTRGGGGYVGVFDPGQTLIQVSYLASPGVILHEAAHGWFNGRLVADRWIAEAFASLAAERAAAALGLAIESPELEDALLDAAFPLNAWPPLGEATRAEDDYGFAASLALAREIAALVGDEALRATWAAAAAGVPAYQPARRSATEPGTESGAPPPDWRALLDLLEENADPDVAAELERIWRRWVIRTEDAALLEARAEARDAYEAAVAAAAPWSLPRAIRDAMRSWQFEAALGLMRDADAVMRQRAAVEEAAAADDLRPPDTLRVAFEGAGGLPSAAAEAAAELAAIAHIRAAEAARIAEPGPFDRLGLIGLDPDADLAAARAAFEAGDQDRAVAAAAEAQATWEAVPGIARGRMIGGLLLGAAVLLAAWLVAQRRRRQRVTRS
ncbi:MAG TPA: hypothetical protein VFX65_05585, partial [Candidatus Limnocylindrales bacterium]|nr:hypothetical protein [Candidatus Limnocylindrales bacterium]